MAEFASWQRNGIHRTKKKHLVGKPMHVDSNEQQIEKLFEDGDRALIAADLVELSRIFADDYIQYDETGRPFTRQNVLDNLQLGAIRYISMTCTGRRIRLLSKDVAIVHGSEDDEVEQSSMRRAIRYIYMDVVARRNGTWQIVASQLARPVDIRLGPPASLEPANTKSE
jgi:hypothetical protein